ncbi:MAG: hypothetical protein EPO28_13645, partial [Saprospiraceae bacterium]
MAYPWTTASDGSPDLYNECSSEANFSVPNAGRSFGSYQPSRSGGGYAEILVFSNFNSSQSAAGEYLQVPLADEMFNDKLYYLRFYVSPDISPGELSWIYTDAIGLALSDTFYYKELQAHEVLPLEPVIENRGEVITDTTGWTKVSGCYIAKGREKYAIIGNFRTEAETMVEVGNPDFSFYINLFYIEDVLIMPFDPLPDTLLLCDGAPEVLDAGFLEATYLWNTGETDSTVTISKPGVYTVEAFIDDCTLWDTVVVLDTRETGGFPSDTVICRDEPLRLAPPLPGSYLWSDGSQGGEITVATSGSYTVTVTNECGEF